jgi:hypothetical protein
MNYDPATEQPKRGQAGKLAKQSIQPFTGKFGIRFPDHSHPKEIEQPKTSGC